MVSSSISRASPVSQILLPCVVSSLVPHHCCYRNFVPFIMIFVHTSFVFPTLPPASGLTVILLPRLSTETKRVHGKVTILLIPERNPTIRSSLPKRISESVWEDFSVREMSIRPRG